MLLVIFAFYSQTSMSAPSSCPILGIKLKINPSLGSLMFLLWKYYCSHYSSESFNNGVSRGSISPTSSLLFINDLVSQNHYFIHSYVENSILHFFNSLPVNHRSRK